MLLCPDARDSEFRAAVELLDLGHGQHVLDVPAGGGYLNRYLPASVESTSIDFAATFSQNKEITKCTETNFGVTDNTFDRVICMAALHHVEDRIGFFCEIKRVLKPTGVLLLADVLASSQQAIFLNGFVNKYSSLGHHGDFLQQRRETTELQNLGFSTKTSMRQYNWLFANELVAHEYLRLLFHLDLDPSPVELTQQLTEIGFTVEKDRAMLPWSLTFIEATFTS